MSDSWATRSSILLGVTPDTTSEKDFLLPVGEAAGLHVSGWDDEHKDRKEKMEGLNRTK